MDIIDSIDGHDHENDVLEPLVAKDKAVVFRAGQDEWKCSGGLVWEELKKQCWIAGPMVSVNLLQYSSRMISVMLVGHLGELALSSASIATSFANVSGFTLLMGMASTLETLCGQAYGAKQYHLLGIHLQRAIFVLFCVSIPVAVVWAYMDNILTALGQDPLISFEAGKYIRWMIPSLFAYSALLPLIRYLQTQSIVFPMMICSAIALCFHVPICWALVYKTGLGNKGAALANSISNWVNLALVLLYIKISPACKPTWTSFTREALHNIKDFIMLAVPSSLMMCLEYWSFEIIILLSGLLPNPKLETSVLSICINSIALAYKIPYGFAAAASNEKEVIDYVASMIPLLAAGSILDAIQGTLSGIVRGCGWQKVGACVNLGAYYIVAIPVAIILAFVLHVGGKGLWLGIVCGLFVQAILLFLITLCTDWEQVVSDSNDSIHSLKMYLMIIPAIVGIYLYERAHEFIRFGATDDGV